MVLDECGGALRIPPGESGAKQGDLATCQVGAVADGVRDAKQGERSHQDGCGEGQGTPPAHIPWQQWALEDLAHEDDGHDGEQRLEAQMLHRKTGRAEQQQSNVPNWLR